MSALAYEVAKFREWARARGCGSHSAGEWECEYTDWQSLYAAVDDFLAEATHRTLTDAELELLLYVLARDNEDEHVLETLEEFPSIAIQIAEAAISCSHIAARWQAAVLAGRIGAAVLVRRFLQDKAEYVRRRADFALKDMERRDDNAA